ncbi:hypothetical protein ASG93_19085 [Paenibacillus sp. Soil787]|nr:hypothetical protein ASG93_19085 [Paenibacillus sp. Soil787]
MPEHFSQVHGAPREVRIDVELSWFDKQAYRLPEASWFSIGLCVGNPNLCSDGKVSIEASR